MEKINLRRNSEVGNEENLSKTPYNLRYIIQLTSITAIGGLLFGYDTGVIAGANLYLHKTFPEITDLQKETIVSMALIGAAISSLLGGPLADKYGRKKIILGADLLFTFGAIIMACSQSIGSLYFGRLIVGAGVGIAAMVVPVYLSENAPAEIRGRLVTINVLFIAGGQLLAILICLALGDNWRAMLGLAGLPSIIQFIGMIFMPESAPWLLSKEEIEKAQYSLKRIYPEEQEYQKRLEIIQEEANHIKEETKVSFFSQCITLFKQYRKCVIIGCMLQVWQQLVGINTAMYYGPEILKKAFGGDEEESKALLYSIPLAGMNTLGTIVAIFYIDKLGRRFIMLRTIPGIVISMFLISLGFYVHNYEDGPDDTSGTWMIFFFILIYLAFFSIGMGSTPWTINSEIYPLHLRGVGNSLATFSNWVSNSILSEIFLSSTETPVGQSLTFFMIGLVAVCAFVFVYKLVPETKGKTLEQVLFLFTGKNNEQQNSGQQKGEKYFENKNHEEDFNQNKNSHFSIE